MAKLKPQVKRFIVKALACHDTPSQVAEAVKEEFGLEVTRMQVSVYDPDKAMGEKLSKELVKLFRDTRAEFKKSVEDIPIAQRAFRLRAMAKILERAQTGRNAVLALQALEQAARETGDAYVNRSRGDPNEGLPVTPVKVEVSVTDARVKHDDRKPSA